MTSIARARARAMALLAITAAAVALSGCTMIGQLTNSTPRDASGAPTAANTNADVFSIKVGDCLDDASSTGTVTTAPIVPCNQPHDSEAYTSVQMKDGAFPGADAVTTQANETCAAAYPAFIGIPYDDSDLSISYYFPTKESWANGDRQIMCTVYDNGVKTTGTLKNAER